jgi:diacylglycerol O-acyltransferase-1
MGHKKPQSDSLPSEPSNSILQLYRRTPLAPAHNKVRQSPLALSDNEVKSDLRGFMNLGVIVIIAMCGQLVIENLKKYGVMLDFNPPKLTVEGVWASPYMVTAINITVLAHLHLLIEKLSWSKLMSKERVVIAHLVNINLLFWTPLLVTFINTDGLIASGLALVLYTLVIVLKMISFIHFNYYLIRATGAELEKFMPSLNNPAKNPNTLLHLWYFLMAPTLCYQLEYPRSPRIRISFLFRRLLEVIFCAILGTVIIQQYIVITVRNTMPYFEDLTSKSFLGIFQRVLKLAIPSLFCWLLFFYGFFHAYLNLLGELLKFGDRGFYKAWWNSRHVEEYWRLWNLPVHKWMIRHLYTPIRNLGYSRSTGIGAAFLFSAVMHEVIISVPCHRVMWCGFVGMLLQFPLCYFSKTMVETLRFRRVWGNWLFWISFCIFGQPLGILLYAASITNLI